MKKTLITNEMIRLVNDSMNNDSLKKFEFNGNKAFYIGRCRIVRDVNGGVTLYLEEGFNSEYGALWNDDVGYILKCELRKKDPEIYELVDRRFRALLKKISDEELESYTENKFAHIKIGDYYYTIIRIIKPNGSYSIKDYKNDYYSDCDVDCYTENQEEDEIIDDIKSTELF